MLLLPPERAREIESKYGILCGGSVTCTSSYVRFKDKGRVLYALYISSKELLGDPGKTLRSCLERYLTIF